jgi:hypothetical protein
MPEDLIRLYRARQLYIGREVIIKGKRDNPSQEELDNNYLVSRIIPGRKGDSIINHYSSLRLGHLASITKNSIAYNEIT